MASLGGGVLERQHEWSWCGGCRRGPGTQGQPSIPHAVHCQQASTEQNPVGFVEVLVCVYVDFFCVGLLLLDLPEGKDLPSEHPPNPPDLGAGFTQRDFVSQMVITRRTLWYCAGIGHPSRRQHRVI